ncbi:TraB/GumN family protein [Oxalobacteraceae bacterium R-40]|uniref:TraB/GumN family protein n=1 Tax=Keguizhuia sedimenti TaxID=3064264 RepID=A0ABU1BLB9_9BURK|nr:TraB/GumN family protein [Oxalobacteraceae bacterium R-40]
MRIKLVFLAIALFHALTGPALAAPTAGKQAAKTAVSVHRGTLYQVEHKGQRAYLFGTVHIGHPAFYPLDAQTMKALSSSTRLAVEFDSRNTAAVMDAMARYAFYPNGERIDPYLSVRTKQQLRRTLPRFGLSFEKVAGMKPWMIANLLIGMDAERDGLSLQLGTETFLLDFAVRHGLEVVELETADYQLALFDAMPPAHQEIYLQETLTEIASGEAERKLRQLIQAWQKADDKVFRAIYKEIMAEDTLSANFMRTVLLDLRNVEMASKIDTLLERNGTSFVAVGLLHLIGDKGLPELLRRRGYTVQKLH